MEPQRLIGQPVYADDHCGRRIDSPFLLLSYGSLPH
jgi:hypothetical protein